MTRIHRDTFRFSVLTFFVLWFFIFPRETKAQSLPPETEAKIRAVLDSPQLKDAQVGLSILDLGIVKDASAFPAKAPVGKSFRVLFEQDAQKKFMPASNMKLFTAAISLQLLGKEKTFATRVWAHGTSGDALRISGGGDPSLSGEDIKSLADEVAGKWGGKAPLVVSEGAAFSAETFDGKFPFGWTLDDTLWYYAPEVSALAINRNQLDLIVTGGGKLGDVATIMVAPDDIARHIKVINNVQTGTPDLANRSLEQLTRFHFSTSANGEITLTITGKVAPGQVLTDGLAVPAPENLVTRLFIDAWDGVAQATPASGSVPVYNRGELDLPQPHEVIAQHDSPPLKVLFQRFLKNSDNLYAEMLLRDAAYYHDGTGGDKAALRTHEILKKWLIEQNIDIGSLRFEDGSGLSRYNLLTPRATAELLGAINRMKDGDVIWNALPIAGMDGTLRRRMGSAPAIGNVRAKTGTFSIASNLSGYVTTQGNRRLAVALYINFARDTATAQQAQDEIFEVLAGSQ